MRNILLFLFLLFSGCSSHRTEGHPSGLDVVEINPDKSTAMTKQNILHLAQVYDLTPFLYTKKVHIEPYGTPRSHPVLTLNTRHAEDPKKILATFLHEELYWWMEKNKKNVDLAVLDLKKIYPRYPVNKSSHHSIHVNLLISYIELRAMEFYLGKKEAREVMASLMKDKIRPWVYSQVLSKEPAIKDVVKKYALLPPPLT